MKLGTAADLQSALVVVLLWTGIWLAVALPAWVIKRTLDGFGLAAFPARAVALTRQVRGTADAFEAFSRRVQEALESGTDSVRLYIDQKQRRLRETILSTEQAVRLACQGIDDLADAGGPKPILDQVRSLRDEARKAASFGGAIDDTIEVDYAARSRALFNICFLAAALAVLIPFNGSLLSRFFDGLIPGQILGVKVALIAGLAIVAVEVVLGYSLADVGAKHDDSDASPSAGELWGKGILIGAIALAALFEAIVLGLVSHDFDIESELADAYPILRYWMAIVGVFFVIGSSFSGLRLHVHLDRYLGLQSSIRVKRELRAANAYVEALPDRWDGISKAARQAEHSIENYLQALGGSSSVLEGTIDRLRHERDGIIAAIRDARVDQWPDVFEARPADLRWASLQNLALFLFSLAGLSAYTAAIAMLAAPVLAAQISLFGCWATGAAISLALYAIGFLPFGRVQTGHGGSGRVFPLRPGRFEYALFGVTFTLIAIGLIWLATWAIGGWGALVGLLLAAAAVLVCVAGYFAERASAGAGLLLSLSLAFATMSSATVWSFVRIAALSLAAAAIWLLNLALSVLAAPVLLVLQAIQAMKAESGRTRQPASVEAVDQTRAA